MKTLLIAYGNLDRQDDGAAWHTLYRLAQSQAWPHPEFPGDETRSPDSSVTMLYLFQLLPEYAETIAEYDRVIFIDAHNAPALPDFSFEPIKAAETRSTFTHHMEAQTLLEICATLYDHCPQAWLMTIKGHEFQFSRQLTSASDALVNQAVKTLLKSLGLENDRTC